jgi:hypothetical protein
MVRCPECGSTGVQKASAMYSQSSFQSRTRSSGVWFSSRGPGVWFGRSRGTRASLAAQDNAPPEGASFIMALAVGAVTLLSLIIGAKLWDGLSGLLFTLLLTLSMVSIATFLVWKWTAPMREQEWAAYGKLWYCRRCGTQFQLDTGSASEAPPSSNARAATGTAQPSAAGIRRSDYRSRVESPVQRARQLTRRDIEALREIIRRAGSGTSFDPQTPWPLDLGIASRLASQRCLAYDAVADQFIITPEGQERAR